MASWQEDGTMGPMTKGCTGPVIYYHPDVIGLAEPYKHQQLAFPRPKDLNRMEMLLSEIVIEPIACTL